MALMTDDQLMSECSVLRLKSALRLERRGEQARKSQSSAIIAADVRRFGHAINTDEVFGTHRSRTWMFRARISAVGAISRPKHGLTTISTSTGLRLSGGLRLNQRVPAIAAAISLDGSVLASVSNR
jgi:hypothetical protein